MNKSTQLASRFKEVMLNGTWIANTNYQQILADVNFEQATRKISDLNTIALLTFHINYYVNGLNHFFEHHELTIKDKHSFDAPVLKSAADWEDLKQQLINNSEQFSYHVENMSDEQIQAVFVKVGYGSYERNIDAMIEHAYYHLGQISLIKKMVLAA